MTIPTPRPCPFCGNANIQVTIYTHQSELWAKTGCKCFDDPENDFAGTLELKKKIDNTSFQTIQADYTALINKWNGET